MKTFDNLAQRGIYYFLSKMPSFSAISSKTATENEQEAAYIFIKGIYTKLFDNLELLGLKSLPDDFFENWWTPQKEKPGLGSKIRSYIKNINIFIDALYNIVNLGQAEGDKITLENNIYPVKTALLKKIENFEIVIGKEKDINTFIFPNGTVKGLKLLAEISLVNSVKSKENSIHKHENKPFLLFSRGVFNPDTPYTAEIFRSFLEYKQSYDKLMDYFAKNNFIRLDNKESKESLYGDIITLDLIKFYVKPSGKIDPAWKTGYLSGISFMYSESFADFIKIGLHIPYFKEVLENYEKMNVNLQQWIPGYCKCTGCRYCVQMIKQKQSRLDLLKQEQIIYVLFLLLALHFQNFQMIFIWLTE